MEVAINYSTQAVELLQEGKIQVDRLKCADWPDMIAAARSHRPVYVHYPLQAGLRQQCQAMSLEDIAAMRDDTATPLINTHLIAFADEAQSDLEIESAMRVEVGRLVGHFGAANVVAENIPYYPTGLKRPYAKLCVDPLLIHRVLDDTGCGLLLDLSHARIAATNLEIDPRSYIESLPVHRLRELHVTGVDTVDGRLLDHMPLAEEDWRFVEWALQRIRTGAWSTPWCIALEYGGVGKPFAWRSEKRIIAEQLPRLYAMVHDSSTGW